MVEVEILGQVITHRYGTLNSGDVLRTDLEFAKHLVEDCSAAKYRKANSEQGSEPATEGAEGSAEQAPSVQDTAAPTPPLKPGRKPKAQ
jgi:hypothetical protein